MTEEVNLVRDLAVILIAAGVFTIISKALKQPLILGYIIAGFLVGPNSPIFPNLVGGSESVDQWSEIGIIFLLFGLGLEFSFKKLLKVGSPAMITAAINCVVMFFIGIVTGTALGWKEMECIFLGGMMSMSSTTIIVKSYGDLNLTKEPYAPLVFGTLVVEDLIAVLMMVLLTTFAVSEKFSGMEMLLSLVKLLLFLVLCFLIGMYALPPLFRKAQKYLTDEILLIVSIGLCFGMVTVAEYFGFSSALGAFLMGSLLSETVVGERIHKLNLNIKDLFGAVFFVSVGMMVNLDIIGEYWATILVLTLVAMAGIMLASTSGMLLSGKDLNTAVHTGFSLAQLGEFSFIIAGLGTSLGVLSGHIYPIMVSVSVITTFFTPYMIKAATPVSDWLHRKLPSRFLDAIQRHADNGDNGESQQNEWLTMIKAYVLRIVLYGALIWLVSVVSKEFVPKLVNFLFPWMGEGLRNVIMAGTVLLLMSPFLIGMSVTVGKRMRESVLKLVAGHRANRYPIYALVVLRVALAVVIIILVLMTYLNLSRWMLPIIFVLVFALVFASRFTLHRYNRLEAQFFRNLNGDDVKEADR